MTVGSVSATTTPVHLADWEVDPRKYPDGLTPLIDHIKSLGMSFGLWFEPEMINPNSNAFRAHPDWALGAEDQIPGRHQQAINMALRQVQDYLFERIGSILSAYDIEYIKWDHNRVLPMPDASQTRGTYALLDRLRAAYPDVEVESCASGGGRIDFGILGRTHRVWLSDSNDALERLHIQHNASLFLPMAVTGSHVGPRRCHTSGRILDIRFRAWVAAQRHMGFEMDPRELTEEEAEVLRQVTSWWKSNRHWLIKADILRLDSSDPAVIAEQHLADDGARFVVFAGKARTSAQIAPRPLRLTRVSPDAMYQVQLLNREDVGHLSRGSPALKFEHDHGQRGLSDDPRSDPAMELSRNDVGSGRKASVTSYPRTLGTCYYPEHWSRDVWEDDARRMAELGLTWVRIGEFAWSRLEPREGAYDFGWLDEAIGILHGAGLKVVLGTPTATPPRWMVDKLPDMLAVDADGHPRKFGSRRHYCFSHEGYKGECARIVTELAKRYGDRVEAWQTDNEYGCHDTVISYSKAAEGAFRTWLRRRYNDVSVLNAAWGNVFWSMDYDDFDQIDLPNLTVTEPNPAHTMAFRRFSSDQVVAFNRLQVDIIRAHSDAPIAHNYMGRITDFDHFDVGTDLDIASWDSYPLGFLEDRSLDGDAHKMAYARQGDPDFQAFHHDLYRAVGQGRLWIMEQQPGPVNWAPFNPDPLPGMVRLWSWEAFAHGAEAVCYFRWRQAPMAQEQMHAGLLRPDSAEAPAFAEAQAVAAEIADAPLAEAQKAEVALIFDYASDWAWSIQPHGRDLSYFQLVFETYRGLRRLGLSVDVIPPQPQVLEGYKLILAPGLMIADPALKKALAASDAEVLIGPRFGARTADMSTPVPLPPAMPGLDVTVARVESLRPGFEMPLKDGGSVVGYREVLEGDAEVRGALEDGTPVMMGAGRLTYLGGWLAAEAMERVLANACTRARIATMELPEGVRIRDTATERFWFNYSAESKVAGGHTLAPTGVHRELL